MEGEINMKKIILGAVLAASIGSAVAGMYPAAYMYQGSLDIVLIKVDNFAKNINVCRDIAVVFNEESGYNKFKCTTYKR